NLIAPRAPNIMNYEIVKDFDFENSAGMTLNFKAGERITLENSYHFSKEQINQMLEEGTIVPGYDTPIVDLETAAPDTSIEPVDPDPTATPSQTPDTTDEPTAPVSQEQQAYDGPVGNFKITGPATYSDEQG